MATSETVTPEARGKAAARDRWLAQMGGLRKNGTFRKGKMRGKTYDQANQEFEGMWTNAPEALKESYAQHARSGATKSEVAEATGVAPTPKVTNASLNATKPGETTAQAQERFRQSRTGVKPAPKPAGGNSFADLTKAPAIPAGGVNSVGNGEFEGGRAQTLPNSGTGGLFPRSFPNDTGAKQAQRDQAVQAANARHQQEAEAQKAKDVEETNASRIAVGLAPITPTSPAPAPITPAVPAPLTAQGTPPAGQPVQAVGATPSIAPAPQIVGPPRGAMPAPEITGKPVMGDAPKGVNRLTGLPMGYLPGDDVSGASSQIQQRAGDSVRRQEQAAPIARQTSVAPVLPPRGPASQPVRTGSAIDNPNSAFSDAAYARTAAAQQTGVETTAIRAGTASDETRAKHPELVSKIAADTAAMAGLSVVRPGTTVNAPRATIVPGVQPARQPLFRR